MSDPGFIHLRVHSAYSLLEGATPISRLIDLCLTHAMPAVAVTDTNNLFGGLEFSLAASAKGIQPIIGCQLSVSLPGKKEESRTGRPAPMADHPSIVLLVQDEIGYGNLLKLISRAYLGDDVSEGTGEDPHVTFGDLSDHSDGLIALTGGTKGPIGQLLLDGKEEDARAVLKNLKEIYPNCLYMEIQRHGMTDEAETEDAFLDMAYTLDVPLVATNEVLFPEKSMFEAHDALTCIAESAYVSQDVRKRLTPEHYFKSADEMRAAFADLPEAIANTITIAKRTGQMVEGHDPILPPYDCGEGRTEEDALREQARAGLEIRLETHVYTGAMSADEKKAAARPYRERLEYELNTIEAMGFPGYFLIVAEFILWAKDNDIPVGPGRGSGAGSVVAWALTITDLDPLRWGLLFERFLNPERVSMPDFDIDFCQDRRDEVIRHVQEKYGRNHVAQIITFGKLQARAVLRDVGRVLGMAYGLVDKLCKLVPNNPANPMTLGEAILAEPLIRQMIDEDPQVARLVTIAKQLEGLYRHASTHAAGVVIGDRPLNELIPLYRDPRSDMPVSGFNMKYVEQAGLVKFDFLGLKTLTVLSEAVKLVAQTGVMVDLSTIPLDDPKTFSMLGRADTIGVFQLESSGMRDVLRKLRPDTFEDIIAVVALYRPGPMDNIPSYIRRKHGEEEPDYLYPTLEGILKETFGIMIYQEQVMQIAQELSGYTLGSADLLRRAMGKKIQKEMDEQRQIFVEGAKNKGVPEQKASDIFDQVAKFAGYGFNKSHAAAYALVAYQTAYMKANHPVEFLAASMTLDLGNTDKLNIFRQELDRMNVPLSPPDVAASGALFTVRRDAGGKAVGILYALGALKNVGEGAMELLALERDGNGPFKDISDFANRIDPKVLNKGQMENLIRSGAFDVLNPNRRQLFEGVETLLGHARHAASERNSDQIGLFGGGGGGEAPALDIRFPDVTDWSPMERLKAEFDAIGFYLSAHPLDAYGKSLERLRVRSASDVIETGLAGNVTMAGTVTGKKERVSAKGNRYAFVQLSDGSGVFELTVFSDLLSARGALLEPGQSVYIKAAAQFEGDQPRFVANSIESLDVKAAEAKAGLWVEIASDAPLAALKDVLGQPNRAGGEVTLVSDLGQGEKAEIALGRYRITPQMMQTVHTIAGIVEAREI